MMLSWQKRRGEFNHNWLKNKYLPALGKLQNLLDDYIEDDEFWGPFITDVLPKWESHRAEARDLIENFELEMSPRVLLEHDPFSRLDNEVRIWLSELVHNLWLTRYPVTQWIEEAIGCMRDVDDAYKRIKKILKECPDNKLAEALKQQKDEFREYNRVCRKLGKAFETFPSRILFT